MHCTKPGKTQNNILTKMATTSSLGYLNRRISSTQHTELVNAKLEVLDGFTVFELAAEYGRNITLKALVKIHSSFKVLEMDPTKQVTKATLDF